MTTDEALEIVAEMERLGAEEVLFHDGAAEAAIVLAAEVLRLRAAVEAVRALPHVTLEPSGGSLMLLGFPITATTEFHCVDLADVLEILESKP